MNHRVYLPVNVPKIMHTYKTFGANAVKNAPVKLRRPPTAITLLCPYFSPRLAAIGAEIYILKIIKEIDKCAYEHCTYMHTLMYSSSINLYEYSLCDHPASIRTSMGLLTHISSFHT